MSSKSLKDGVETLDGEDVEYYTGRFAGTFDIDTFIGANLALDDQVSFVVTARVADPAFKRDSKTGVLTRCNKFTVEVISPLDPSKAAWIYDNLGQIVVGVTSLTTPAVAEPPSLFEAEESVPELALEEQYAY